MQNENDHDATSAHAPPGVPDRDDDVIHVFYLYIEESPAGFRWQIRQHERPEPVEIGPTVFSHDAEAQSAGRLALDRVFSRFRRQAFLQ